MTIYRYFLVLTIFFISLLLVSCGIGNDHSGSTDTPTQDPDLTSLPPPAETIVPQDTITVTPQVSPFPDAVAVILLTPDLSADPQPFETIRSTLEGLAAAEGLNFEVRSTLDPSQLEAGVRLVVALPPDPGLENMAASAQHVQFLAVGIPGLGTSSNLSVIPAWEETIDRVSFLAGYIAAVVTPEWRVGVIAPDDSRAGLAARQGFLSGAIFFCGLCQQTYPPHYYQGTILRYPLYSNAPSGSGESAWKAAADDLIARSVNTVYVAPGVGDESMLSYLVDEGIRLIGTGPPPQEVRDHWITSVRADYAGALSESWPRLLAGEGGFTQSVPVALEDVNLDLFSPGRQILAKNLLPDLLGGLIDTGVNPINGQDD